MMPICQATVSRVRECHLVTLTISTIAYLVDHGNVHLKTLWNDEKNVPQQNPQKHRAAPRAQVLVKEHSVVSSGGFSHYNSTAEKMFTSSHPTRGRERWSELEPK